MSVYPILAFFLLHSMTNAQSEYCQFNQGYVGFCRLNSEKLSLRLPINAQRAFVARVEDSDLVDPITLEAKDLEVRHEIPKLESNAKSNSGCEFGSDEADFIRFVDISNRNIQDGSWYVLCAEYNVITKLIDNDQEKLKGNEDKEEAVTLPARHSPILASLLSQASSTHGRKKRNNPENSRCMRCSVIRLINGSESVESKLLHSYRGQEQPSPLDSSVIRYRLENMPFASAKISGRVINIEERRQVFQFTQSIRPRQQAFVRVPITDQIGRYAVINDLLPNNKNGSQLVINNSPLVLQDHLVDFFGIGHNLIGSGKETDIVGEAPTLLVKAIEVLSAKFVQSATLFRSSFETAINEFVHRQKS